MLPVCAERSCNLPMGTAPNAFEAADTLQAYLPNLTPSCRQSYFFRILIVALSSSKPERKYPGPGIRVMVAFLFTFLRACKMTRPENRPAAMVTCPGVPLRV